MLLVQQISMERIYVVAVLLLALSAMEISEALNFFQKHVVRQMGTGDCNRKMRKINRNARICKKINTFFLDPDGELDGICNMQNQTITGINLRIIACKRRNRYSPCFYRGIPGRATGVRVICNQNNRPVHLKDVW
uniref:Ribonuclease A-domain domain-containing protein n=1 Tax=Cyprinodon variegatus TaxID=28743 RepID=A0A3Q2G8Q5_CYPVA